MSCKHPLISWMVSSTRYLPHSAHSQMHRPKGVAPPSPYMPRSSVCSASMSMPVRESYLQMEESRVQLCANSPLPRAHLRLGLLRSVQQQLQAGAHSRALVAEPPAGRQLLCKQLVRCGPVARCDPLLELLCRQSFALSAEVSLSILHMPHGAANFQSLATYISECVNPAPSNQSRCTAFACPLSCLNQANHLIHAGWQHVSASSHLLPSGGNRCSLRLPCSSCRLQR